MNSLFSAKKVEEDTGDYHVDRVSTDFSRALAEARRNKGMTQAQLAQAINEKPSVVSEYESGKASLSIADRTRFRETFPC